MICDNYICILTVPESAEIKLNFYYLHIVLNLFYLSDDAIYIKISVKNHVPKR